MTRLALIRHGHTHWNRQGRIQGRTDIPLDADAETHLSALTLPPDWQTADLVASPLSRAMRTGTLIADRTPSAVPELIEMNWGLWEGKKGAELLADPDTDYRHIEDWGWDYRPPEGESPAEVRARLLPWVHTLSGDTIAVCHIGIMRVLLAIATGWGFTGPAPFRVKRDRLFVLDVSGPRWSVMGDPVRLVARP